MTKRSDALAERLKEAQWEARGPKDARKAGIIAHHVASVYPLEIQLAQTVVAGRSVSDLSWDTIHQMTMLYSLRVKRD